tara:strand:- start:86 stop:316 length:231 start_codon:yes stop_codon:yes gene_type:complete
MKIKVSETTQNKLRKLHKEGFLDNFLTRWIASINSASDARMHKILKSAPERERRALEKIRKDPEGFRKEIMRLAGR